MRNVLIAVAVLVAGVVGLFLPVSVFDGAQSTVACGNAVVVDEAGPATTNVATPQGIPPVDLAAACDAAVSSRRHWAIPLVIVGGVGILFGLATGRRRRTG